MFTAWWMLKHFSTKVAAAAVKTERGLPRTKAVHKTWISERFGRVWFCFFFPVP